MDIISGKKISKDILNKIKSEISSRGSVPGLAVILVGKNEASHIYVGLKEKAAKEVGIYFQKFIFDENEEQGVILEKIKEINASDKIDGVIVQLPLPEKFDAQKIINAIDPKKDVDGFHPKNIDAFFEGKNEITPVFPSAVVKMIQSASRGNLKGKEAIVIANSERFGDVMCSALKKFKIKSKYVFCEDIKREKPKGILIDQLREADIIITACGVIDLVNVDMVKDGAIVIDGGIAKRSGKVFGDIDFDSFKETDCVISPVPGGVGPMTVACLLENVYLMSIKQIREK